MARPSTAFPVRFTATDVALLADMDALHGTVSGPATKKLMERACLLFGDARFERLEGISVSHLYNLRGGTQYQRTRRHWTTTRPTGVPIGQRRAPQPNGIASRMSDAEAAVALNHARSTLFQAIAAASRKRA